MSPADGAPAAPAGRSPAALDAAAEDVAVLVHEALVDLALERLGAARTFAVDAGRVAFCRGRPPSDCPFHEASLRDAYFHGRWRAMSEQEAAAAAPADLTGGPRRGRLMQVLARRGLLVAEVVVLLALAVWLWVR